MTFQDTLSYHTFSQIWINCVLRTYFQVFHEIKTTSYIEKIRRTTTTTDQAKNIVFILFIIFEFVDGSEKLSVQAFENLQKLQDIFQNIRTVCFSKAIFVFIQNQVLMNLKNTHTYNTYWPIVCMKMHNSSMRARKYPVNMNA